MSQIKPLLPALLLLAFTAQAHDHRVPAKPTKAQADLDRSRKSLTSAKRALAAQGRYACCAKPSSSGARANGL